jgi:hypothetical protein
MYRRAQATAVKVHLLYEPAYFIPRVGNLTEEKSFCNVPAAYKYQKYIKNGIL